jgi:hypothetical protein
MNRLRREAEALFGKDTVRTAINTDIVDLGDVDAESLADIAELLAKAEKPSQQINMVRSMIPKQRLALCMWVLDTGTPHKLLDQVH